MSSRLRRAAPATLLVAGAALSLLGPLATTSTAEEGLPPGLGIRLLEAPTNRADDPRARSYVVDRVAPGAQFIRRFEVSNGDDGPADVRLYPAAAVVKDGAFAVRDAGVAGEVPSWVTMNPPTLRLAPHSRAQAQAVFHVDAKAVEGEYYGGLVAERPAQRSAAGVVVDLRVAIRVYLSVGSGGEPRSDFTIATLAAGRDKAGAPLVVAAVRNTGGRALDMSGKLRLSKGPGGLSAGPFPATLGTTLGVGQTEPVTVRLDKALPAGPWLARLDLASGLTRRAATATILFPSEASKTPLSAPVPAKSVPLTKDRKVLIPIASALVGLLLLALVVLWLIARRRRGTREQSAQ